MVPGNSARQNQKTKMKRQRSKKITKPIKELWAALYAEGHPTYAIAAAYRTEQWTVLEVLRRSGVDVGEHEKAVLKLEHPSTRLALEVIALESEGYTMSEVSEMLDIAPKVVEKIYLWNTRAKEMSKNRVDIRKKKDLSDLETPESVRIEELRLIFMTTNSNLSNRTITPKSALKAVLAEYDLTMVRFRCKARNYRLREARGALALLLDKYADVTIAESCKVMGRASRSAVVAIRDQALIRWHQDAGFRERFQRLEGKLFAEGSAQ